MSKEMKPVIAGQRLKSRKRDVKEKFDATSFRDDLIEGLTDCADVEAASKFLENNPSKLDYRQYDEALFDVLIAGGLLAPGGAIVNDGAAMNPFSAFLTENTLEEQQKIADMLRAMIRRYKYLQVSLEEAVTKILRFLVGYPEDNLEKLACHVGFLLSYSLITTKPVMAITTIDKAVSAGTSLKFLTDVIKTWVKNRTVLQIGAAMRKGGLDGGIHTLFPFGKQGSFSVNAYFAEIEGLADFGKWYVMAATAEVMAQLSNELSQMMQTGESTQEVMVDRVRSVQVEHKIPESAVAKLIWDALMMSVEWNKKPEILFEQALRHIKANMSLLKGFTKSDRAQVVLMITMQEHAFVNQNFLKIFCKFVLLMYKADVLEEDPILQWYEKDHSQKGKNVFIKEMKPFVDWINEAEEEGPEESG